MKLNSIQKNRLAAVALRSGLEFVRLFGSGARNLRAARDLDIAVGGHSLSLEQISELVAEFEVILGKPIDLIQVRNGLSPLLVKEIARDSLLLWEKPRTGLLFYTETMDRLYAVAEDEQLAYSRELRDASMRQMQKRLRVS